MANIRAMNKCFALVALMFALALAGARAQTPDDQYVRIYNVIQAGDSLSNSPEQAAAGLTRYLEAQAQLQKFQNSYPDWNPKVVGYRLNYLASKIAALSAKYPNLTARVPAEVPAKPPAVAPNIPSSATTAAPPNNAQLDARYAALNEDVRRLQADKSLLEAKLKEAVDGYATSFT